MKHDYKKYKPKQYKPYWWVAEKLKFGFVVVVIVLFCFGIHELYKYFVE